MDTTKLKISKFTDTFWAALIASLAFLAVMTWFVVTSHGDRVILLFLLVGLIPCIWSLTITGRQYYLSERGITAVYLGFIHKTYEWVDVPTIGLCELSEKPGKANRYFIIFLQDNPIRLSAEMRKTIWYETHPGTAILFPYSDALFIKIGRMFPSVKFRNY